MKIELTENIKWPVSFYPPTERTELKRVKVFVSSTSLNFSLDSITLQKALRRTLFNRENVFIKTLVKLIPNTSREPPKQVVTNRSRKIIKITSNLNNWHCFPLFSIQSQVIMMIQVLALYVLLCCCYCLCTLKEQRRQTRPRVQFTSMAAAFFAIFRSSTRQSSLPLATSTMSAIVV